MSRFKSSSINYVLQSKSEGLAKFIRNCPANSSCILLSVKRFFISGGCEESLYRRPDIVFEIICFRKRGFLKETVASMPIKQTPGSLSAQIRRSRYESILALIKFCEENQNVDKSLKKLAFKRALSRAHNYNRSLNKRFFSLHFIKYAISKFYFPKNYINLMYSSLRVFTKKTISEKKNGALGLKN